MIAALAKVARDSRKTSTAVTAKATFYSVVFLGVQYTMSQMIVQTAYVMAATFLMDSHLQHQCSHLHDKGLECSTALYYHRALDIAAALILLIIIRGFKLHVEQPKHCIRDTKQRPVFLRLQSKYQRITQMMLVPPIAVVHVYTRASRPRTWTCLKLLLVQASASCMVFLLGNCVCLLAALPVSAL